MVPEHRTARRPSAVTDEATPTRGPWTTPRPCGAWGRRRRPPGGRGRSDGALLGTSPCVGEGHRAAQGQRGAVRRTWSAHHLIAGRLRGPHRHVAARPQTGGPPPHPAADPWPVSSLPQRGSTRVPEEPRARARARTPQQDAHAAMARALRSRRVAQAAPGPSRGRAGGHRRAAQPARLWPHPSCPRRGCAPSWPRHALAAARRGLVSARPGRCTSPPGAVAPSPWAPVDDELPAGPDQARAPPPPPPGRSTSARSEHVGAGPAVPRPAEPAATTAGPLSVERGPAGDRDAAGLHLVSARRSGRCSTRRAARRW